MTKRYSLNAFFSSLENPDFVEYYQDYWLNLGIETCPITGLPKTARLAVKSTPVPAPSPSCQTCSVPIPHDTVLCATCRHQEILSFGIR